MVNKKTKKLNMKKTITIIILSLFSIASFCQININNKKEINHYRNNLIAHALLSTVLMVPTINFARTIHDYPGYYHGMPKRCFPVALNVFAIYKCVKYVRLSNKAKHNNF